MDFEEFIIFETFKKIGRGKVKFILKGNKGALLFMYSCHETDNPSSWEIIDSFIGINSHKPLYKSHTRFGFCPYLDGKECYYEGYSFASKPFVEYLLLHGEKMLWKHMKWYYSDIFRT